MANKAAINTSPHQKALRSIGRIPRIDQAIEKATLRENHEKVASLLAERNRRVAELQELKEAIDTLDL